MGVSSVGDSCAKLRVGVSKECDSCGQDGAWMSPLCMIIVAKSLWDWCVILVTILGNGCVTVVAKVEDGYSRCVIAVAKLGHWCHVSKE
jgi:hypothetical protein